MTTTTYPCTCRGYDPADPCGHGDTSEGCPRHDPGARDEWIAENRNASGEGAVDRVWSTLIAPAEDAAIVGLYANFLMNTTTPGWRPSDAARAAIRKYEQMGREAFREYQSGCR